MPATLTVSPLSSSTVSPSMTRVTRYVREDFKLGVADGSAVASSVLALDDTAPTRPSETAFLPSFSDDPAPRDAARPNRKPSRPATMPTFVRVQNGPLAAGKADGAGLLYTRGDDQSSSSKD